MSDTVNAKDLVINGVVYAKYDLDKGVCFIKVIKPIIENDIGNSEEFCVAIISNIEEEEIKLTGYLNI